MPQSQVQHPHHHLIKNVSGNTSIFSVVALLVLSIVIPVDFVTAQARLASSGYVDRWDPGRSERDQWGAGLVEPLQHRMERHWTFMLSGVPSKYRGQRNPLSQTPEVIRAGGDRYQKICAECHGALGLGNGVMANSLNPSPALLAYLIQMPMAVDQYLMWSISEGGKEFGTGMPAFKDTLSEKEIWEIVAYMRAGFPQK
jgi:mono/diheme cytochrome c family protein